MRVIVTGGTGLIGRALAGELAKAGREVVVLSREPGRVGLPSGVRAVAWDGRTPAGWGGLVDGADAIVNLAGESIGPTGVGSLARARWTIERKRRIRESRLGATRAVGAAIDAASARPRVLVQASAVGYYGPGFEEKDENAPPGTDFLARVCVEWETASAPVEAIGVRRAIVRTGLVLSDAGGVLPLLALPFRLFVGGRLGHGRQPAPWIHLDDVVGAICFLIEDPEARGPFNLAAPEPSTNAALGRAVARALRRPALLPVPGFLLRLILGEMATLILDGQRAMPRRLSERGYRFRHPDLPAALTQLLR